ncbi:MAG: MFS transporter, partial [Anaerolineales bacterium]|nr:MFS transporter [Anaerolineales bacterium]
MMPSIEQDSDPSNGNQPVSAYTVFRQPNFRWLFLGTILANSATWIQQVTMSWLVYDLTASGTMLGTINLVSSIATLGLAPAAGVAIDRISRKKLMFTTNSWFLAINISLGLALLAGSIQVWPLFVFALLGGMAVAFDQPLRQTVLFTLVPRRLAPSALALSQTGWALMRTLGPAIGGFLLLWIGAGGNFLVQAGVFAIITLTIIPLNFPPTRSGGPRTAVFSNIAEGFKYVMVNAHTRAFFLMGWVLSFFIIPVFIVMPPIFAKDLFHGGPQVLGSLLSAVGFGGIVGGLVATSLKRIDHRGRLELAAMLFLGLSLVAFALSTRLWVALVFSGLAGFFEMIFIITNTTLLQLSIPDELRGRVNGIITLNSALVPLGSLIAGSGADLIGPRPTAALLSGAAAAIAVIVFW